MNLGRMGTTTSTSDTPVVVMVAKAWSPERGMMPMVLPRGITVINVTRAITRTARTGIQPKSIMGMERGLTKIINCPIDGTQHLESMKYILKFYEVADSDHSYISLEVDGVVAGRNYDPLPNLNETTEEGTMWLNQTLEGEATKEELESLKRILKLN